MPVLPWLEDSVENVLSVAEAAAEAGARFVYPAFGVTMRDGQREHFLNGLDRAFPEQGLGEKYRPAVWKPVYLLQSQSGEVVGTIFQTLRGAGAVV